MAKEIISGIYSITNKIDGKFYIGSSKNLHKRWMTHRSELRRNHHCNQHLQSAWNKYGEENFEFLILEEVKNLNILKEIEQKYIDKLHLFGSTGYNLCNNTNSYTFGYKRSEEYKEKLRKPHTEEHIQHLKENHAKSKVVIMFDLFGNELYRFPSASETVRKLKELYNIDTTRSIISGCCRGKYYKVYGFIFLYEEDYKNDKSLLAMHISHIKKKVSTKVVSISYDFNDIKFYDSIESARSIIGAKDGSGISACCSHIIKTSYGYFWLYYDEYLEHKGHLKEYIMSFKDKGQCLSGDRILQLNDDYSVIINKWDNYDDIYNELGISHSAVLSCLNGKSKSCGGFRWVREFDYINGNYIKHTSKIVIRKRKIVQCDLNDNLIKQWDTPNDVTKIFTELKSYSIRDYCEHKHKTNTYNGYNWYFADEYFSKIKPNND